MTNIIKVKFLRNDQLFGREYTYYTLEEVAVGDIVELESKGGIAKGIVTKIDVPEEEIAPFKDKAKAIIGKAQTICECEKCYEFTPIGEGDHICNAAGPPRMIMVGYQPTDEYEWCKGSDFKEAI